MKQSQLHSSVGTALQVRRPIRPHAPSALPLGEILRNNHAAEDIAEAILRAAGAMEAGRTRAW